MILFKTMHSHWDPAPSLRSQSGLLPEALPGQGSERRPPARSGTSAPHTVCRTRCCLWAWRSGSRPAAARKPRIPTGGDERQTRHSPDKDWPGEETHTRMEIWPSCLCISPSRADTSDVFPQPTWPTTASREPCGTITLMLQTHHTVTQHGWYSITPL